MKNTLRSCLALFLCLHAPIIGMEDTEFDALHTVEALATLQGNGITLEGFRSPQPITMAREIPDDEQQPTESMIIRRIEEHIVITPEQNQSTPITKKSLENYPIITKSDEQSGDGSEGSDEDIVLSPRSALRESIKSSNISGNLQSDIVDFEFIEKKSHKKALNQAQEFFGNDDKKSYMQPEHTIRKIVEILLADPKKQEEMLDGTNLAEIIAPQQESLEIYYGRLAPIQQLIDLFIKLRSKIAKMPIIHRQQSAEFEQFSLISGALQKRIKKEEKNLNNELSGLFGYTTKEKKILDAEIQDASDLYRQAKDNLTFIQPEVKKLTAASKLSFDNLTKRQDSLVEQRDAIIRQLEENHLKLEEEERKKQNLELAFKSLEDDRIMHKVYLERQKTTLEYLINVYRNTLALVTRDCEKAVVNRNCNLQRALQEDQGIIQGHINKKEASLALLSKNLKNYDSPTGTIKMFSSH